MLSRHGLPQPIRDFAPTPAPNRVSASAPGVCRGCTQDVFNASLGRSLLASHAAASPSYTLSYSRLARDIYTSIREGCRWCNVVGSAVLTNSELEYWMRDWNGSHSDGASLFSTSSDGETSSNAEDGDANDDDVGINAEEDATENPGFVTVESLACNAGLEITIEVLKWADSQVFNLVKVTVEVATSVVHGHCPLQEMVDDDAVVMTLEVICEGRYYPAQDALGGAPVFPYKWDVVSAADVNEWAHPAESWLRSCKDYHVSCAPVGNFQPTRLIDVRDPNHPRLFISGGDAQDSAHPYAVLSYVWGPKQDYVLTKATIGKICTELDLSRTPKTISDAMKVAHRLGFDYLWVDALCIIQDSPEDKAMELPLMANVYKESSLCIVAATAAAASEGFLTAPTIPARFMVEPFRIHLDSADGYPSSLTFAYRAPYMASADPISTRAWTLQERVLSWRLLLFGRNGVMWMCRECFINPGAAPDAGPPYQTSLGLSAGESESTNEEGDHTAELERWMAIRADYSEMDLTYCTDKLPAISAVAAEVGRRTGWTYLAGMWAHNLFSELHWRCTKPSPSGEELVLKPDKVKKAGYIAPSWSWASVGLGGIVDSEDERGDREAFEFTLLECHVDADPDFPFGPVSGGYLKVQGKAVQLAWRPEQNSIDPGWDISLMDEQHLSSVGTPYILGEGALDPLDKHLDPALKLVCLGMSKLRLGRERIQPVEGLLLLPSQSDGGVFHRIGFFRMNAPSVFDGVTTSIFRIE